MADSALDSIVIVLVQPQDPVNIAGTIRAMKNMGVTRLRLVDPAPYTHERIIGIAHDTEEIVASVTHCATVAEALAGCVRVFGFTARRRAAKREVITPKAAASVALTHAADGEVAIMFGREDRGLSNDELDMANTLVTIPTTGHPSLNLAQAVLIALYELHLAADDATRVLAPPRKDAPPATSEQFELAFADAERALEQMEFFKMRYRAHVLRSLRSLVFRANPDAREILLLRALGVEVQRTIERIRRKAEAP
jgi:TrmH family RNA methyltransferase